MSGVIAASPVGPVHSSTRKKVGPSACASTVIASGTAAGTVPKGYIDHAVVPGSARLNVTVVTAALPSSPSATVVTINSGELSKSRNTGTKIAAPSSTNMPIVVSTMSGPVSSPCAGEGPKPMSFIDH